MSTLEMEQRLTELERALSARVAKLEEQVSRLTPGGMPDTPTETGGWKKSTLDFNETVRSKQEFRETQDSFAPSVPDAETKEGRLRQLANASARLIAPVLSAEALRRESLYGEE